MAQQQQLQNRILAQLPAAELKAIQPRLMYVELKQDETALQASDSQIKQVYFPLSGMVSLLSVTQTGEAIETGIVGSDGIVGGSCAINGAISLGEAVVQLDGAAMKMNAGDFVSALPCE